jgi:hypothetical protein
LRRWDSSKTEIRNDKKLEEWREEYGEDSDFWRVRVQGLPPNASDLQYIPSDMIAAAQKRNPRCLQDDPLIAGCDLSWGGDDASTIRFRCGSDAKSIPPIKVRGAELKDESVMVVKLADVLSRDWVCGDGRTRKVAMLFIDSAGICGPVCRRLRELGYKNIQEINFGAHSPDKRWKLQRSYMFGQLKEALPYLAIDASPDLEADLQAPGYRLTKDSEILLESKQDIIKRLGHSTDDADSLVLTYAAPVQSRQKEREKQQKRQQQTARVTAWT